MNNIDRQLNALNHELILRGRGKVSRQEIFQLTIDGFSPYFTNRKKLIESLSMGFLAYDYIFFHNHFKGSIFEDFFITLLTFFHDAKDKNSLACFTFLADWQPQLSLGIQNSAELAHIEIKKDSIRLDILAKVCFQEIGDFIEGSFQPFLKLFLGLDSIKKGNENNLIESLNNESLGGTVNKLIQTHEDLGIMYKHCLKGIPLNQWRNIANHKSYKASLKRKEISCTYGKSSKKKRITLTRDELLQNCIAIHNIACLHRIANNIFYFDNSDDINLHPQNLEITEDSIVAQFVETFYMLGFEVQSLKKESDIWECTIKDNEDRDQTNIEDTVNKALTLINTIKSIPLLLVVMNSLDEKIIETSLK